MPEAFIVKIENELPSNFYNSLLLRVSHKKRERAAKFKFKRDAVNTLLGEVLVRAEICRRTGLRNDVLVFSNGEHGKPFVQGLPDFHFNISHTKGYLAYAIAKEPVGIDIELIEPVSIKIADKHFAPDERDFINTQTPEQMRVNAFYEIWTKKESFVKMEGAGLSRPLSSFSVLGGTEPRYHKVFCDGAAVCHMCVRGDEAVSVTVLDWHSALHKVLQFLQPLSDFEG